MKNLRPLAITATIFIIFGVIQYIRSQDSTLKKHFILAHNTPPEHPVHAGMMKFAEEVKARTNGKIDITIYPGGQLGPEKDVLELVQLGAITMTKASSLSLESFSPIIGVINIPFIFKSQEHYFRFLDSSSGEALLRSSIKKRLRGLTYYDAGSRNFYSSHPILKPEDMKGLKIRVMENQTAVKMLKLLGGAPTPMPYGEVYAGLQQGVIDGAENNITAITVMRHGEVSKYFSRDEHIFSPDILIISEEIWKRLTPKEQEIIKESAEISKYYQRKLWAIKNKHYEKLAKEEMGVKFLDVDKSLFRNRIQSIYQEYEERSEDFRRYIQSIKSLEL